MTLYPRNERRRGETGSGKGSGLGVGMIRVCAVCGMGSGVGEALRGRMQEALDSQGVRYELKLLSANEAADHETDLVFITDELVGRLSDERAPVIAIQNFTNRSEVREKVAGAIGRLLPQTTT